MTQIPNDKNLGSITFHHKGKLDNLMNVYGGVHGGALFIWVDLMTKLSVSAFDSKRRDHS